MTKKETAAIDPYLNIFEKMKKAVEEKDLEKMDEFSYVDMDLDLIKENPEEFNESLKLVQNMFDSVNKDDFITIDQDAKQAIISTGISKKTDGDTVTYNISRIYFVNNEEWKYLTIENNEKIANLSGAKTIEQLDAEYRDKFNEEYQREIQLSSVDGWWNGIKDRLPN